MCRLAAAMKMSTQYDLMFRVPDDWRDRSVQAFTAPPSAPGRRPATFVAMRHPLAPGKTLQDFAEKMLYECAQKLEGFQLIEKRNLTLGNRFAHSLLFEFQTPKGRMTHLNTIVPGDFDTVICLTASVLSSEYAAMRPVLQEIINSIRLPDVAS